MKELLKKFQTQFPYEKAEHEFDNFMEQFLEKEFNEVLINTSELDRKARIAFLESDLLGNFLEMNQFYDSYMESLSTEEEDCLINKIGLHIFNFFTEKRLDYFVENHNKIVLNTREYCEDPYKYNGVNQRDFF
ncbi:MAG: hypothetical protein ACOCQR_03650 [bacterium]